jgi:hypothetical protein
MALPIARKLTHGSGGSMALTVIILGVGRRFDIELTEEEAIAIAGLLFMAIGWLVREEAPPTAETGQAVARRVLPI